MMVVAHPRLSRECVLLHAPINLSIARFLVPFAPLATLSWGAGVVGREDSARGVKGCAIDRAKHGGTTTPAADTLEV